MGRRSMLIFTGMQCPAVIVTWLTVLLFEQYKIHFHLYSPDGVTWRCAYLIKTMTILVTTYN